MPEQTKAGDVGHRVDPGQRGELRAGTIEAGSGIDHRPIVGGGELSLLERRRQDADAERLAEDQRIPGLRL